MLVFLLSMIITYPAIWLFRYVYSKLTQYENKRYRDFD